MKRKVIFLCLLLSLALVSCGAAPSAALIQERGAAVKKRTEGNRMPRAGMTVTEICARVVRRTEGAITEKWTGFEE